MVNSCAKINIFLKIKNKDKATNYHNIESLMVKVPQLYDTIDIVKNKELNQHKVSIQNNTGQQFEESFILQTLNILTKASILDCFFDVTVTKNIPIMSGLGGGSSNGAAVLNYLSKYFQIDNFTTNKILKQIGYDSFFFSQIQECNSAICTQLGDIVTPVYFGINNYNLYILIVKFKNESFCTKLMYSQFKNSNIKVDIQPIIQEIKKEIQSSNLNADFLNEYSMNDFESLIVNDSKTKKFITKHKFHLSGSGSACFKFFNTQEECNAEKHKLKNIYSNEISFFISNIAL